MAYNCSTRHVCVFHAPIPTFNNRIIKAWKEAWSESVCVSESNMTLDNSITQDIQIHIHLHSGIITVENFIT